MRSFLASLRNLVLPVGAETGTRIILNGDLGLIQVYDPNGNLVLEISGDEALKILGSGGGTITISVDALGDAYQEFSSDGGEAYRIEADDDDFSIAYTNLAGRSSFHVVPGEGIALRSGSAGANAALFDDTTGYILRGTYTPGTWTAGAWTNAALQNGWTNYGGQFPIGHYLDPLGFVNLRGVGQAGTLADGTTVFTLPVGRRPAAIAQFHVYGTSGSLINVGTDGTVKIYGMAGLPAGSPLTIDGFRFSLF